MKPGMTLAILISIGFAVPVAAQGGKHKKQHPRAVPFAQMDSNGDRKVSFDEFLEAHRERLRRRFDRIDTDHDGTISELELAQARSRGKSGAAAGRPVGANP